MELGAYLNLGHHHIGNFGEACTECGEEARHRFGGATFGPAEVYLCGEHAALTLLASAGEADGAAVTRYLVSQGFTPPQRLADEMPAEPAS